MKKLWTLALLMTFLVSCKTQQEVKIKSTKDYKIQWENIEEDIKKGFPEKAHSSLSDLIQEARANGDELVATRAVLEKIRLKNLDFEEFYTNQKESIAENIELTEDPVSLALLYFSLAKVHHSYWSSMVSEIPTQSTGDDEWSSITYSEKIDSLLKLAMQQEISGVSLKELGAFLNGRNNSEKAMLWDFIQHQKIEMLKSGPYEKLLGEELMRELVDENYGHLIDKLKVTGSEKLALEIAIDRRNYFSRDIASLADSYSPGVHYVLNYHLGLRKYKESKEQFANRELQSSLISESLELFENVKEEGDRIYKNDAQYQIEQLTKATIQVMTEQVLIPGSPSLLYTSVANLKKMYVKVFRLTEEDYLKQEWNRGLAFQGREVVYEDELNIPEFKYPYVAHSSEFALPGLELGYYGIIVNPSPNFKEGDKNPLFSGTFLVSGITINEFYDAASNKVVMECVDRLTGDLVDDASFTILERDWNSSNGTVYKTYSSGIGKPRFSYTPNQNSNLYPMVKARDEFFFMSHGLYHNDYSDKVVTTSNILTDRSVYRPGQEIHYHGILYRTSDDGEPRIVPGKEVTVSLSDNFGNEIGNMGAKTDEYGAYSGVLTIPEGTQNGNMNFRLTSPGTYISAYKTVRLEEYKRPKFEVNWKEVEQKLALDELVVVEATAMAYTGIPLSGANVKYKVYRNVWYPYFYRSSRSYPMRSLRLLVDSGQTSSNRDGGISIEFIAKKPLGQKVSRLSFSYEVEIDVIDQTGETISAQKFINISEQSVFLLFKEQANGDFNISAVNAEQKALTAEVEMIVYSKKDQGFTIERYWEFPDTSIADPALFPRYAYDSKEEAYSEEVYRATLQVEGDMDIDLKDILGAGDYKVVLRSEDAEDMSEMITIVDFSTGEYGSEDLIHVEGIKGEWQPGETLRLRVGTAVEEIKLHVLKYRKQKLVEERWVSVSNTLSMTYAISEADYGGFSLAVHTYYGDRQYSKEVKVQVPRNHKQLLIKPKSMRLVTEPGITEKWTFIVSDQDGKPVESNLLASMYDASLDAFQANDWKWNLYQNFTGVPYRLLAGYSASTLYSNNYQWNRGKTDLLWYESFPKYRYDSQGRLMIRGMRGGAVMRKGAPMEESVEMDAASMPVGAATLNEKKETLPPPPPPPPPPAIRTNLAEMVFFYPNLRTDKNGEVEVEFTNNDALTKWKFQSFAFNRDLAIGFFSEEVVTRKELMIQANQPRFLRSGDKIQLSAKISNLSEKDQEVHALLVALNEVSQENIGLESTKNNRQVLKAGEQTEVAWEIDVPADVQLVKLLYTVEGEGHSDGEQYVVPVLPNEIFLVDSETVLIDAGEKKSVDISKMLSADKRTSLLTVEATGTPAWYAIRSLPYLMDREDENSEAIFNRYFANALALKIINENPLIEEFYKEWKAEEFLRSPLSNNDELRKLDLGETPWLANARSEEEVMKQMAVLFDRERIEEELAASSKKLQAMQMSSGAFPWYEGGRPNYYMSQYLLEGILKLEQLNITGLDNKMKDKLNGFCALEAMRIYKDDATQLSNMIIRNVWIHEKMSKSVNESYSKFVADIKEELHEKWYEYGLEAQTYIAEIFMNSDAAISGEIVTSLLEKSFFKEQLGRFWNNNPGGIVSSWDISMQARMIALFAGMDGYRQEVDDMKFWLVSNKRTNSWSSSIATASAIYALTLGKASSFSSGEPLIIKVDDSVLEGNVTAGTNYQKESIRDVGEVNVMSFQNKNRNKAWANVHHQFFQNYEDVERTDNEFIDIKKELYKVGSGDELSNVEGSRELSLGDRIRVRLVVNVERPMQFVHISDERPSGAEPADLVSGYQWRERVGHYKSIKDLGTHFFIDNLEKGKYVFEYDMFINNLGKFSAGVAEIQNYYAPEFNDYSKSVLIQVER